MPLDVPSAETTGEPGRKPKLSSTVCDVAVREPSAPITNDFAPPE